MLLIECTTTNREVVYINFDKVVEIIPTDKGCTLCYETPESPNYSQAERKITEEIEEILIALNHEGAQQ